MIIRSKAPLRIGLAGGGTDVSPYSDLYGGVILNATISMYAYCNIEVLHENKIIIEAQDRGEMQTFELADVLPVDGTLDLAKGVYNRVVKAYGSISKGFRLTTFVDAPAGSGLGTSSTLVVAILGAFVEWQKLPLGDYDIAHLAYDTERIDLNLAGGKQDQYAATFGGVNLMEFYKDDKVIVNPLRIRQEYLYELNNNLLLYYTSTTRESAKIIEKQSENVHQNNQNSIAAMHHLKEQALMMKEAILKGEIDNIGNILDYGFQHKKAMANGISNELIESIYDTALQNGATGGKISGAGGGGFMTFYCPSNTKYKVMQTLQKFGGLFYNYQFTKQGLVTWTAK
jgi:D-glycero-alpha-D-manno-heptose-7-phosphate kinase